MSRLVIWDLVTLDGLFEAAETWHLGWHEEVRDEEPESVSLEQLSSAERLLLGRVTDEGMAAYWPSAGGWVAALLNGIPKVVFPRTLKAAGRSNTRLVTTDAVAEVSRLKREGDKETLVIGRGTTRFGRGLEVLKSRLLEARR